MRTPSLSATIHIMPILLFIWKHLFLKCDSPLFCQFYFCWRLICYGKSINLWTHQIQSNVLTTILGTEAREQYEADTAFAVASIAHLSDSSWLLSCLGKGKYWRWKRSIMPLACGRYAVVIECSIQFEFKFSHFPSR